MLSLLLVLGLFVFWAITGRALLILVCPRYPLVRAWLIAPTVGPPKTTSHVENTMEERSALGIPENMIRCSVGIENIDDIKRDFLQALESL